MRKKKGGDAYYILAHQYIAAYLNQLNGADTSAISTELNTAGTLLSDNNPGTLTGRGKLALRQTFVNLAGILDNYNNGIIGPGHCEE